MGDVKKLGLVLCFTGGMLLSKENKHWAFLPPQRYAPPKVKQVNWPRNALDVFILARIEKARLKPSPEVDRTTLLRRVYLDIIGLPPSPMEVKEYLNDKRPQAYEIVVKRLLASKHYGERWGRHWLDLARYADSDGYSHDAPREIWRYRDWVINAVNDDLPFDQFVIQQLAGDMLPNATMDQRIATGFHRNTQINTEGGVDKEQFRVDSIFDRIATTGEVMFGLTFGCTQCHDHKFDPLKQVEFYRMFAFFNQADEPRIVVASEAEKKALADHDSKVKALDAKVNAAEKKSEERKKMEVKLAKLKKARPRVVTTLVMAKRKKPRTTHRFVKGDFTRPAERVEPGVPVVLHEFPNAAKADRLDFAKWVASKKNPLLARVTVNRIWQHYFGIGLVETENDFGTQGTPPTNPELLDWLATEFMRVGWSRKAIHKLIVTSATYQQTSSVRTEVAEVDPYNKLLARQSRLRLDAEIVRDVALAASGLISRRMGGPGVFPPQPVGCMNLGQHNRKWTASKGEDRFRRAVYTYRWRATPHPSLKVFDTPDAFAGCTKRMRSNTPLQALTLLNDPAFFEISKGLADRIIKEEQKGDKERVSYGFQLCLSRMPDEQETLILNDFLIQQRKAFMQDPDIAKVLASDGNLNNIAHSEYAAWVMLARVLLNLDETITRE